MTKEKFKQLREDLKLSQSDFAILLGYNNFNSILRKEKGQTPITRQDEIIIEYILKEKENEPK